MAQGLVTEIDVPDEGLRFPRPDRDNRVIALILSPTFPEMQLVEETVRRGVARFGPSAVWVVRETDSVAQELLGRLEVTPVALPLNPHWKYQLTDGAKIGWFKHRRKWVWGLQWREVDHRKEWRDREILRGCDDILVFVPVGSGSWWDDYADRENVHLIRRGKIKRKR